jgi:hypothetical protein
VPCPEQHPQGAVKTKPTAMKTIRTQTRTRWPEPFGLALRLNREPARITPATDIAQNDFLLMNPRPDLLEPEPGGRFRPYPIDLP